MTWPNVERGIVSYLKGLAPTYTQTVGVMPDLYITVERVGGAGSPVDQDVSIEVTVSSRESRGDMWDLAATVEDAMRSLAANDGGGIYIDDVSLRFGFGIDMPTTQGVWQATATFSLTLRPQIATMKGKPDD